MGLPQSLTRCHRAVLFMLVVCLLALPARVLAQQGGQTDQSAERLRRLQQAIDSAGRPADVVPAGPPDVTLTAAEEAEIGADGKRMAATRTLDPPVIDGLVDDDVWARADVVTDFLQREPVEAAAPSERTEVRILYDEDNIYIAFVMYDSEPDKISASDLRRDSRLGADDTIAVLFDTYHDHRNGFLFRVNPLGTKYDATLKDERQLNAQWDEKWEAAARITERGWEAEMQIPWKVLRYDTGSHIWGIDFKREIRRRNEELEWSNYRQGFDFRNVSQAGHLVGLRDLKLTDRYRFKPYLTGGYAAFNATDNPLTRNDGDFGLEDFKYQLTPNLTADLTINTDFAQVEDDRERVNLTRFPLFFPERREFFLEGADKFSFGGGGAEHRGPSALIYHSRNIGLYEGNPVGMRYGAKLTGKMGSTSIGFINAMTTDAFEFDYLGQNYTAVRVKQDVLERSSIGMIFTNVQGGGEYNRVGGIDASFRFWDYFDVSGFIAQARDSEVDGAQYLGSLRAAWDSDLWSASASFDYVDADFQADLGFVRRHDMMRQNISLGWKPRPRWGAVRQIMFFGTVEYITDTDGEIQTRNQNLFTRFGFESGDAATVSVSRTFERLQVGFSPSGLASVPAGDYSFTNYRISFDSFRGRTISGRINFNGGGFFNGTRNSYGGRVTWRSTQKLSLSPSYSFNRVDLPTGSFSTHLGGMRASYNFSDRWLTSALVQYNSVSQSLSVFARLNFIYRTGDDFFLVFKSNTRYDEEFYGKTDQTVIAKMTRSWDF